MAPISRFTSDFELAKTQLAVVFVALMLAMDVINPVKIILHVFPFILPWHVAAVCVLIFIYIVISEMKEILYFCVKVFFHSILSIFFREVEIIGVQNIPTFGPCIFSVNHANQFVDAVMLVCTCQRKVSYLMAEVSYQRRIIGDLAWALGVVPVKRAQDDAGKGTGKIIMKKQESLNLSDIGLGDDNETSKTDSNDKDEEVSFIVKGMDTIFIQELRLGDKIRPPGTAVAFKVTEIVDGATVICDGTGAPDNFKVPDSPVAFDILKRVDQKQVYEKVLERLATGGSIGIFPEGGSHDRTDLLPLKVGVALIAYSALEKDGINVPIVPVGLNYFQAHRWRGRAVVEFGRPIRINPSTLKDYKEGGTKRRAVCSELLDRVQDSMKSVIISAPDYETLQLIHTARRLYSRKGQMQTSAKQDLNRRFAEGYKRLLLMTNGSPPKEWLDIQDRLIAYHNELSYLGIRDYHVPTLSHENDDKPMADEVLKSMKVPYQIVHLVILLLLAAVPTLLINLPVGVLAGMYSESRRKVLLSRSKVKVRGYDVVLTEKIMFCIVMVPFLWILDGFLLYHYTDMDGPTLALAILSLPMFAYIGIIVSEAGMVDLKDLRPWVMQLFPSSKRRLAALPETRLNLQRDLRKYIKKLGPVLGEIYYGKDLDWHSIQERTRLQAESVPLTPTRRERSGSEISDSLEIPAGEAKSKDDTQVADIRISQLPATIESLADSITIEMEQTSIEEEKSKKEA